MINEITAKIDNCYSREEIRYNVIKLFCNEIPGTGNRDKASKYNYFVEKLQDGKRIVLKRPANLNKGFDFLITVEGYKFSGKQGAPTHSDIINDLQLKCLNEKEEDFYKLIDYIIKTFNCSIVGDNELRKLNFCNGYSAELIVKVCKWFFIEQDVTYWNYSGRNMLMMKIKESLLTNVSL